MAGGGGGAWKVAYADFVTALMAFFLVMWILAQNEKVKEAVAGYFREPLTFSDSASSDAPGTYGGRSRRPKRGTAMSPTGHPDETQLRNARGLAVARSEQSGTGAVLFFDENSDALNGEAEMRLSELIPLITGKPHKIEIRGHTSRRPLPADSHFHDPWQLSFARCEKVMDYLEQKGISRDRMRLSQAAGNEPFSTHLEPEYLKRNPRVEVFLLNEVAHDPSQASAAAPTGTEAKKSEGH